MTRAGALSMYIYLLHIWLLMPFHTLGDRLGGGLYILGAFLYSFAVWAFLATGIERPIFKCCIEPRIDCLVQPWVLEDKEAEGSERLQALEEENRQLRERCAAAEARSVASTTLVKEAEGSATRPASCATYEEADVVTEV